jgi:hypothetical protein
MKEQKFLIVYNQSEVQHWLDRGWEVVSVTAQYVSTGGTSHLNGGFAVVLEFQQQLNQQLNS